MKKSISLLAVAAAVGLSALTASPANAAGFKNCTEAAAAGQYNIHIGAPGYAPDLDRDGDGIACEDGSQPHTLAPVPAPEAAPAPVAVGPANGFDNCAEAAAAGQFNIPIGAPGYGAHLDSDKDGIACEQSGESVTSAPETVANSAVAQIPVVPVGGADTGVAQQTNNGAEILALGGLVAAATAGTVLVARRQGGQA